MDSLNTNKHSHPTTQQQGPIFSQQELEKLFLLGESMTLRYRKVWLQMSETALAQHPISQHEFLVMFPLSTSIKPGTMSHFYLLCVEDWESIHTADISIMHASLRCAIVGSFQKTSEHEAVWRYSSQFSLGHAHFPMGAYAPSVQILNGILNGLVTPSGSMDFGFLRYHEQYPWKQLALQTRISMHDFLARRTAMFGKTRFGKSNAINLICQGMLHYTQNTQNVGQLIFDVNGEYSNTNPRPGQCSLVSANPGRCTAYFLNERQGYTGGYLLRFNFYQFPEKSLDVLKELLPVKIAEYDLVRSFLTCRLANLQHRVKELESNRSHDLRKVMLFWSVLDAAGFSYDSDRMKSWLKSLGFTSTFNPGFSHGLRQAAYQAINNSPAPIVPTSMASLMTEINMIARFRMIYNNDPNLFVNGKPLFDAEEDILMRFLCADNSTGPRQLRTCLPYHSPVAEDFIPHILMLLAQGGTVIIDLSSAAERVVRYFAEKLTSAIFAEQEQKFNQGVLEGRYIQIYFEEAHNIFPLENTEPTKIYARIAKEGAKFHIGIVFSTQSPTTINTDLMSQTENFFIGHLSSQKEVEQLCEMQVAFRGFEEAILINRTPGLLQVLTQSHRYVVPMQAHLYEGRNLLIN
jgi:hypothetical protein